MSVKYYGSPRQDAIQATKITGVIDPYDNSVVPGEYSELVKTSDEIPSSSDVAGDEDSEGEDGEGVHRITGPTMVFAFGRSETGRISRKLEETVMGGPKRGLQGDVFLKVNRVVEEKVV